MQKHIKKKRSLLEFAKQLGIINQESATQELLHATGSVIVPQQDIALWYLDKVMAATMPGIVPNIFGSSYCKIVTSRLSDKTATTRTRTFNSPVKGLY